MTTAPQIDVHLAPADLEDALRADVRTGLTATPKWLPPKWFYDERGSELFSQITRLPEYYPTRCERQILDRHATAIVEATDADALVELGSGTSEKTLLLLDAFRDAGRLDRFVPFDVSEATLRDAARAIDDRYPGLSVHAVVGDFDRHLGRIPAEGRRLVAFLGGTIGNFAPPKRRRFLDALAGLLDPGEHLLLGTDLVKDEARLVAAYDDAQGITADFNRNVLHVINAALGADFVPERFAHESVWNAEHSRIEMWLRSDRRQTVSIPELGLEVVFERGEAMCTEWSCKFTETGIHEELGNSGFETTRRWTDDAGDYALTLARRC